MKHLINLVLLVVVLAIAAWVFVELLLRDWPSGRQDHATATDQIFAEMRAALEAGCTCADCTYIRVLLAGYDIPAEAA